jgi:UDP-N-acetylglucosamine--N-acetylmuramyl-(pentapeptide) pyrophosphoryl-undecaprenol N-acetylglucosamine transferase
MSTVLLSAGGTGGHLFPAMALAQELGRRGHAVELATDHRGDRYGQTFPARAVHIIDAATLAGRSPIAAIKTAISLARGTAQALKLINTIKPSIVVGFGGYPTFPPLLAARLRRVPTLLHEQNAVLGRANRMLAKRVDCIAISFDEVKGIDASLAPKVRVTGNPVRDMVISASATPFHAPTAAGDLRLIVFGGSQGARYFSDAVPPALALLSDDLRRRLVITQQCRSEDLARVEAAYTAAGLRAELAPFFADLPARMAACHLVIGRAGASSVAELTVLGRPSLLVPLPHALDNDQLQNANRLADAGGTICIEQKDLLPERLAAELSQLFNAPERLTALAQAAKRLGRPDAVARLANEVEHLITRR